MASVFETITRPFRPKYSLYFIYIAIENNHLKQFIGNKKVEATLLEAKAFSFEWTSFITLSLGKCII